MSTSVFLFLIVSIIIYELRIRLVSVSDCTCWLQEVLFKMLITVKHICKIAIIDEVKFMADEVMAGCVKQDENRLGT